MKNVIASVKYLLVRRNCHKICSLIDGIIFDNMDNTKKLPRLARSHLKNISSKSDPYRQNEIDDLIFQIMGNTQDERLITLIEITKLYRKNNYTIDGYIELLERLKEHREDFRKQYSPGVPPILSISELGQLTAANTLRALHEYYYSLLKSTQSRPDTAASAFAKMPIEWQWETSVDVVSLEDVLEVEK